MYSRSKNKTKRSTPINFNTNYRREMKLVPINMDYCLHQFDALNVFVGVHLHRESPPNFDFFQCNHPNLTTKTQSSPLKLPGNKFSQHF